MNGTNDDVKALFFKCLEGRSVTTKGLVSTHDEALDHAGVQQIWDYLKLDDLRVTKAP